MSFRFQRRIKLFPGFYLNVSKSGISASAGVKGFTVNSRGMTTVGIPGTGLSYRHNHNTKQPAQQPVEPQRIGYSSDQINDQIRQLNDQIYDKAYLALWTYDGEGDDYVVKILADENCPASIRAQAKLLVDMEAIDEYVRDGMTVEECSDRVQEIIKAIVAVIAYGQEMCF